ncbi:MAG: hypothetical protein Q9191_001135 [Dirinaria sp. TL-2023a]
MEFSSPLATMQPQAPRCGTFGESNLCWQYAYEKQGHALASTNFNCGFNFEALSVKEARMDYFNHKPVRGSSPTSTLVADLSQNLLIDQRNPTPRRALFSSLPFSRCIDRASSTTPPIPSSSPGPGNDPMDISPLPHKAPFIPRTTITTLGGTGGLSATDERLAEANKPSLLPACMPARRKSSLSRPTLRKGFSTTAVTISSAIGETRPPSFSFAPELPEPTTLFAVTEGLTSSPSPEKRPQSANSPLPSLMFPPKLKPPLPGLMRQFRSGSPGSGHVRKISAPSQRPRKQFRRSLSMTDNPADIMKENKATYCSGLDPIKDIEDGPQLQLPHFRSEDETVPRITKETMVEVLDGKYCHRFDRSIIIDCRFEYEYEGGHIDGAVNFNSKEALAKDLFEINNSCKPQNALLILHCEYSAHRAPIMAQFVRHRDRATNADCYPALTYPELYILDGGYSSFFSDHRLRCTPQEYVTMKEKEHLQARRRGLGRVKQERQKLNRAQTFAFGQHEREADNSPLAAERHCGSILMAVDTISIDPLDLRPAQSRRMASY